MLKNRFKYGLMMLLGIILVMKYGYGEIRYLIAFLKMKANLSYTNVTEADLLLYLVIALVGVLLFLFGKLKILEYEK